MAANTSDSEAKRRSGHRAGGNMGGRVETLRGPEYTPGLYILLAGSWEFRFRHPWKCTSLRRVRPEHSTSTVPIYVILRVVDSV